MIRLFCFCLLSCLSVAAHADELRPGYLEFTQKTDTNWAMTWKSPLKNGVTKNTLPLLPKSCAIQGNPVRQFSRQSLVTRYQIICSNDVAGQEIGLTGFAASQTDVLVRVAILNRPVQAMRLTADNPVVTIGTRPDIWQVAKIYFITGIDHILFGYDHLLFVIALMLLLGGAWSVVRAVTAFTIAHSITLVGTTLGFLGLAQAPVEATIALSIMFLAVEILKKNPAKPRLSERIPWVVAFLFGLLHGFGFAGALKEIGLPESDVPTALLTFNLGVEAGQLMIVIGSLGLLHLLRHFIPNLVQPTVKATGYIIGTIASMWFFERIFL